MPTLESMRGELAFSSRLAVATLDALAESGDFAGRTRALRALGNEGGGVNRRGHWIGAGRLAAMWQAAAIDRRIARRLGQALVRPDGVGLALCYGGLATTEKAYRRVDSLLARESKDAEYEPRELEGERARIRFHPPAKGRSDRPPDETGALLCAARSGMLEAVPLLFGLVPARVRETQCGYAGAPHCEFEVTWSRNPRVGLVAGAAAGLVIALGLGLCAYTFDWSVVAVGLAAPALAILTAAAGRSIDLARQLEAVAGARRGHLALLDQLDTTLAERMDDLAKVGPVAHAPVSVRDHSDVEPTGLVPVSRHGSPRTGGDGGGGDEPGELVAAGRAVQDAVDGLRDAFAELRGGLAVDRANPGSDREDLGRLTPHLRAIERATAALDRLLGVPGSRRREADLRALVLRSVDALRGEITVPLAIDVDESASDASGALRVDGDPRQLEFVIEQLLRNAVAASEQTRADAPGPEGGEPGVRVSVRATPAGIEVAIEDDGPGIDPDVVERVFDPFDDGGPVGRNGGLGLPVCLRIIQEHGGELQVRGGSGCGGAGRDGRAQGTCVSFVLPRSASDDGTAG